ncbi:transcriptional regulator GlxA family with amidase domain [Paucibacter oligotrophus]|uniref:Transcriptional regulator GlxA family with amidase domain n=1 Tax=Roseateles oligotrophus TaxID=1769250 RepID=A0A840LDH6_9BURK|nr:helix-turn-helix domain-containing protein [Roseateles oligotrophus]MBB4844985.1 transcriptional regulator GlxA family with amidase domain [Roseateles oligotrophus]
MACRIVFVLFPGFQQLDLAGPMAVFELARLQQPGSYSWRLAASVAGSVRSSAGLDWPVQALPRSVGEGDLLMVIGGDGVDAACRDPRLCRWLQRASRSGARLASICSGSLLLAAAGLLEQRAATTHWSRSRQFASEFPAVKLQPERIFVRETAAGEGSGRRPEIWTSAGMTAGIDLCLALVAQDCGEGVAGAAARQLVVERRRPGGQSQFSPLLELQRPEGRFGDLLDYVRQHLGLDHRVEALAARACMSPRHFARCFRAETGATPAQVIERLRVDAARAALEGGQPSVQRIAQDCGFGNAERMRRSFQRLLGQPPAAFRKA